MAKSKAAPSILSTDLYIYGQVLATGDMQIDGTVDGDIRSCSVTVGENAKIIGELSGDDITVKGRVKGVIRGKRVHLCATCHVEGDIFHEALAIENGSFFNGSVHREENPLKKSSIQLAQEPVPTPMPTPVAQETAPASTQTLHEVAPANADTPAATPQQQELPAESEHRLDEDRSIAS